jgi:hypothetical protein
MQSIGCRDGSSIEAQRRLREQLGDVFATPSCDVGIYRMGGSAVLSAELHCHSQLPSARTRANNMLLRGQASMHG